jgi:type IV secretion system protein VirB2
VHEVRPDDAVTASYVLPNVEVHIMRFRPPATFRSITAGTALAVLATHTRFASAQGFDKINTTIVNVNAILVTISIAVVTIAIIWAGFKMIFQGARLADVANVLIGGTLIGGAAAFATYIVS